MERTPRPTTEIHFPQDAEGAQRLLAALHGIIEPLSDLQASRVRSDVSEDKSKAPDSTE
ncbi:MAG: hypothetical protein WBO77_04655 [Microgenomates group bacterium]